MWSGPLAVRLSLRGRRLASRGDELELGLEDLPDRVARQRVDDVQFLGKLLSGEAGAGEEVLHRRERQALPGLQGHEGDGALAGARVRDADDRDALDRR